MKPVLLVAALLSASLGGAAQAQDSAADMIRQGMASRGVHDGYSVEESTRGVLRPQDEEEWDGLKVSEAFAYPDRERGWSYAVVVQNFSTVDYCIRPRFYDMPSGQLYFAQTVNQIVKAGQSLTIFTSADENSNPGEFTPIEEIAFWRPDYTKENGNYCRSVAPAGLDDWLGEPRPEYIWDFEGSRR